MADHDEKTDPAAPSARLRAAARPLGVREPQEGNTTAILPRMAADARAPKSRQMALRQMYANRLVSLRAIVNDVTREIASRPEPEVERHLRRALEDIEGVIDRLRRAQDEALQGMS